MKMDALYLFSDAQALTATAASDNYKNLEAVMDVGNGNDVYVVTTVDTAFTDGSSDTTVTVTVETDDSSAFSTATTAQTLYVIPALAAVGDTFVAKLSPFTTAEQYMQIKYTMANGNLTTGAVTTFFTTNAQKFIKYAKGYSISSSNQF